MHWPMPAMVFGMEPQSVAFAVATAAFSDVGSSLCCSAYPQKSGSMWRSAMVCPIFCSRKRQSAKYRPMKDAFVAACVTSGAPSVTPLDWRSM